MELKYDINEIITLYNKNLKPIKKVKYLETQSYGEEYILEELEVVGKTKIIYAQPVKIKIEEETGHKVKHKRIYTTTTYQHTRVAHEDKFENALDYIYLNFEVNGVYEANDDKLIILSNKNFTEYFQGVELVFITSFDRIRFGQSTLKNIERDLDSIVGKEIKSLSKKRKEELEYIAFGSKNLHKIRSKFTKKQYEQLKKIRKYFK